MQDKLTMILPGYVRSWLGEHNIELEELRLRAGQAPMALSVSGQLLCASARSVTSQELEQIVQAACKRSIHTVMDQLCQGYLTLEGGHRMGVCGTMVMDADRVRSVRQLSSLNLRVARQIKGCARGAAGSIYSSARPNVLILSPPGVGKTTFLRDMIRVLSSGELGVPTRVGLVDERGEVAAVWQGVPQMELGGWTDVLSGCPKALGIELLTRSMNPQVIAVDEITAQRDIQAMEQAAGCGVALLATAHASDMSELKTRPLYRQLLRSEIFNTVVTLRRSGRERVAQIERLEAWKGC